MVQATDHRELNEFTHFGGLGAWLLSPKCGLGIFSWVENTVYRYKVIIGPVMRSRTLQGQRVEARVGCKILNTMAALGMPESHRVD